MHKKTFPIIPKKKKNYMQWLAHGFARRMREAQPKILTILKCEEEVTLLR